MGRTKAKARRGAAGHAFREASKLKGLVEKTKEAEKAGSKRKTEDNQVDPVKEARLDDAGAGVGRSTSAVIKEETTEDVAQESAAEETELLPIETAKPASGSLSKSAKNEKSGSVRHKRAVQRPPTLATDIYVSRKSTMQAQAKRAQMLLDGPDFTFLTIHGLGAAINPAIELALHLKEQYQDQIAWTISLSTVTLVDDVEPEELDDDITTETRQNSAVHIRVFKVNKTPADAN
ncbi:ribonucleases P/MRP protein subunit pop7 [Geranomyces michiganensis]|nr:ribonucleases P/MRP protein subunit pop7 [Geranomyces michiganensis]